MYVYQKDTQLLCLRHAVGGQCIEILLSYVRTKGALQKTKKRAVVQIVCKGEQKGNKA